MGYIGQETKVHGRWLLMTRLLFIRKYWTGSRSIPDYYTSAISQSGLSQLPETVV